MDVELSRAENELQSEEAALHAELSRLSAVGSELTERLGALREKAQAVGDEAVLDRTQVLPPSVDADRPFVAAKAAREAAVRARREVNLVARQQVTAFKATLQKLAQQVLADEKAIASRPAVAPAAKPPPLRPAPPPPPSSGSAIQAAPPPPQKKRQSPRVKMQAAVDFTSDNNFFNGFSANISDGGLFIATVNLVPLGTEVDLAFSLPSGDRIEAHGVVRWVREVNDTLPDAFPGIGVQFSNLNPEAQDAIDQFLAQRDPLFFADAE